MLYSSLATNLLADDRNAASDVFLVDLDTLAQRLISQAPVALPSGGGREPAISADGRYTVFVSSAPALAAAHDGDRFEQIYRFDRQTRDIDVVSRSSNGALADSISRAPQISADGRLIVFVSHARNLIESGHSVAATQRAGHANALNAGNWTDV